MVTPSFGTTAWPVLRCGLRKPRGGEDDGAGGNARDAFFGMESRRIELVTASLEQGGLHSDSLMAATARASKSNRSARQTTEDAPTVQTKPTCPHWQHRHATRKMPHSIVRYLPPL
jgi:hypothetical protein